MSFADGTQTENEAQATFRRARLVRVPHDRGVEQGRGFVRIFAEKIGADQLALRFGESAVRRQHLFHDVGARLERLQQVAMPALEILQDIGELAGNGFGIEREHPVDDMIGAGLVGRVEIARFGRRLERAHDDARRIGPKVKRLPVQESGLQQGALGALEIDCSDVTLGNDTLGNDTLTSGAQRAQRLGACQPGRGTRKLTYLRKTEQIGQDRLAAEIFIGAVGMQAVAATAGLGVGQCDR